VNVSFINFHVKKIKTVTCDRPYRMPFINVNGDMNPCCIHETEYKRRFIVGNIYKDSFEDIWNGKKMNKFRNKLKEGKVPAMCKNCNLL